MTLRAIPDDADATEVELEDVEMEDVERDSEPKQGKKGKDEDDDDEGTEEDDAISMSEDDEGPSSVDAAERKERQVRRTLLFALLSAVGIIAIGTLLSRWIGKCLSRNADGGDVAEEIGETAGDAAGTALLPGGGTEQLAVASNAAAGQAQ